MSIWKHDISLEKINQFSPNTIIGVLGIRFIEIGDNYLKASMPVDQRTHQPYGLLHGGASVVLAETLGSTGAMLATDPRNRVVGLDINANHMRGVREGLVVGTATPLHVGRTTQVWNIQIVDENDKLVCVSRLTMAVLTP